MSRWAGTTRGSGPASPTHPSTFPTSSGATARTPEASMSPAMARPRAASAKGGAGISVRATCSSGVRPSSDSR